MKELLQKLDREYGFQLSEAEMERILAEVRAAEPLFEQLSMWAVRHDQQLDLDPHLIHTTHHPPDRTRTLPHSRRAQA